MLAAGSKAVSQRGPSLLVIDDEPDMLMMLSFVLSREGFVITTVHSGEEAVAAMSRGRYDLVLTDLRMPGMNGFETLRALKRVDPDLMVIVATGYATDHTEVECRQAGAFDLIHKPFDVLELRDLLRRALDARLALVRGET